MSEKPMPEASDDGQLAKQFADNYRSGAQGAEMDYESARLLAFSIDALARLREAAPADQLALYRDIFVEITAKATPLEFDPEDPERITAYRIPCGPLHRAAGKLGFQMFDGERYLGAAIARAEAAEADWQAAESQLAAAALRERAKDEALTKARRVVNTYEVEGGRVQELLAEIDAALARPPQEVPS